MEEVGDDQGCKNGREWTALADALFHEEGGPCAIGPLVVDSFGLFVEEGGEWEHLGE